MHPTKRITASSPEPTFTADDLIAALGASGVEAGDGVTTAELAARLGLSQGSVLERLRPLWRAGKIEPIRAKRTTMIGTVTLVPAYRLVKS